jgi:hypothetical protein
MSTHNIHRLGFDFGNGGVVYDRFDFEKKAVKMSQKGATMAKSITKIA